MQSADPLWRKHKKTDLRIYDAKTGKPVSKVQFDTALSAKRTVAITETFGEILRPTELRRKIRRAGDPNVREKWLKKITAEKRLIPFGKLQGGSPGLKKRT